MLLYEAGKKWTAPFIFILPLVKYLIEIRRMNVLRKKRDVVT